MLKSAWVKSMFPYAVSPCHKETKWDSIGVAGRTSVKLPHYMGPMLVYPMENEMSLIHHVVEQWGCGYTNENNQSPIEKTRGHLMLKPKSKLM